LATKTDRSAALILWLDIASSPSPAGAAGAGS
jgi:hypothetical protein